MPNDTKDLFSYARFGLMVILLMTVGRWALSLSGVAYLPRGNVIFSIVLATFFLALTYGAFLRSHGVPYRRILGVVLILVLSAQTLITLSTLVSYAAGLETYFNYPEALNVAEPIGLAQAIGARLFGFIPNTVSSMVIASLGYALGAFIPSR